jgi:hypothetical protein
MHGDLYAHNTLLGPDGHALIGDFGAASFVDVADRKTAEALERLEVRAYGCLLEELLERVEDAGGVGCAVTGGDARSLLAARHRESTELC